MLLLILAQTVLAAPNPLFLPPVDPLEVSVGPYGHTVQDTTVSTATLPGPMQGLEVGGRSFLWRNRTIDNLELPVSTGSAQLRIFRDDAGVLHLDRLLYDTPMLSVRMRPELGDEFDLALFGGINEITVSRSRPQKSNNLEYARLFVPFNLTLLGFSNTDQDTDAKLKHYLSAGAGLGAERSNALVGKLGLHTRGVFDVRSINRHRGGEKNTVRNEVRFEAAAGLSWMEAIRWWTLDGWAEHITQWETRDAEGRNGVDRQSFAAGIRMTATRLRRKNAPVEEPDSMAAR